MNHIIIAGKTVRLKRAPEEIKRSLWLGLLTEFDLYEFSMNGYELLLLVSKGAVSYSPAQRSKISQRIESVTQRQAVFYFDNVPTYERDRLVDKGVYFIVGDKFAFVPALLANRRMSKRKLPSQLLPATQYLLLLHLQHQSLDGMTIKEIEEIAPYKYPTIARAAQQLISAGLAEFKSSGDRTKRLSFTNGNRELWDKALPYLTTPIRRAGYLTEPINDGAIGGIEALSHYSMLAGEDVPTRVFTLDDNRGKAMATTDLEDIQRVEIWKYPPIVTDGYVDRLSLYLSLRDDNDPRTEKELETIINRMPWLEE